MQEQGVLLPGMFCEIKYRTSTGYDHTVYGKLLSLIADSLTYWPATGDEEPQVINLQKSTIHQIKFIHEKRTTDTAAS